MKVHVVSETPYTTKGNGVHTAFIEAVELLKEKNDVEVVVNGEGTGDVFHSHTYGPYYFWKGRKYKGRRILTVHVIPDSIKGSLPFWKIFMPFVKWYFKKVYTYADVCIAISPMVEQAIKDLNADTRIVKMYNPVLTEKWKYTEEKSKEGRKMLGLSDTDFIVLGVGQLEGRKGVEDFLDIAEAIPEAKFVWAGGRPFGAATEGIARINARVAKAAANVKFIGMVDLDKMPSIYAASDLLLFPSYQENCPLAPLEAAACGMPVVFRNIKEYTLLYEDAYLRADTTPEFIDMTKRLIRDLSFYEHGQKISQNLIMQFDKNNIRKRLIYLYQELVDHKSQISFIQALENVDQLISYKTH
ncbi:MAG: glycosyltransferase family 4 protein [Bacteroidota bacterium]|nr:glycosyltransferase family 4 protein [Bacteroidota bacterium]